jgi:TATA-binding protein-associated factor
MLLIASYDQVRRREADCIKDVQFRYAVLDEGHLIKNAQSLARRWRARRCKASHRLMLSGTPVQNNVLELWSLFDFLMPGFLGSADEFNARYNRPITATRDARRVTSAQVAAAGQALTSLHRQVLPFVLRRLKADVLSDLPPKIIQDVECDMGDVQRLLIEQLKASASGPFRVAEREFCNHPQAFFDSAPPALREQVLAYIKSNGLPPIGDLHHSPKLLALVDLLRQCGIGGEADVTSSHRVLIFAQSNKSLDLIAKLLAAELPQCSHVRLDSSVAPEARIDLVTRFNQDPTIDVMLLTTSVGGLGLTLTGADTVIFFEHDWNPQVDNQAMDRAHRIGQRRVVSVYRLITRGTVEQDIMSLQHFKVGIANAVVNAENSNMAVDLNTNQLLDLYETPATTAAATTSAATTTALPKGVTFGPNGVPADAAQLESESQYDDFGVDKHAKRARARQ